VKLPLVAVAALTSVSLWLCTATLCAAVLVPDDGPSPTPASSGGASSERRSAVSGTVWFDANANGKPDAAERAVRNIQVDLEGPNGYRESRKTLENGSYEFAQLGAGSYKLSVHIPAGFGLSLGESGKEVQLDGRTALKNADFGLARAEMLPSPVATATPAATAGETPRPAPPLAPPVSAPATNGSTGLPGVGYSPPFPRQPTSTAQPTSTLVPTPTAIPPTSTPEPTPTETPTPTPTRTPSALEGQQAAAERARAALESVGTPRFGSKVSGDDVMLDVPFRTALDGSEYSDTNSGTAALAMALEAYGDAVSTADLRALANTLTRNYDTGTPPRLEVLVRVAEQGGLRGLGLNQGVRLAVWTPDGVRDRLRAGYPVLTQIKPDDAAGDGELGHERFVLIVGLKDANLIYHDPAYPDTRGEARRLPLAQLVRAWSNGPNSAQAAALSIGQGEVGLLAPPEVLARAQTAPERPPEARDVPTPEPKQSLFGLAKAPAPLNEVSDASGAAADGPGAASGPFQIHPLLLGFWLVAGAILIRVVAGLVLD
jgi:SdrD B-like protein